MSTTLMKSGKFDFSVPAGKDYVIFSRETKSAWYALSIHPDGSIQYWKNWNPIEKFDPRWIAARSLEKNLPKIKKLCIDYLNHESIKLNLQNSHLKSQERREIWWTIRDLVDAMED